MSRRKGHLPTTLFPMLAVLVSMMGALILLLLIVSQQARVSRQLEVRRAREAAEAAAAHAAEQLASAKANLPPLPVLKDYGSIAPLPQFVAPRFVSSHLPELPKFPDPMAGLSNRKKDLEQRRELARQKIEQLPTPPLTENAAARDKLDSVRRELVALREALELHKEAEKGSASELATNKSKKEKALWERNHVENRFAILPYVGPNGTKRRPIYFECRGQSIYLQPENVEIPTQLILQTPSRLNPLAVIARRVASELKSAGADGEPYPLLLVRPEGIHAYYLATRALRPTGLAIGYELIPSDVEVAYFAADEKIRSIAIHELSLYRSPAGGGRQGLVTVRPDVLGAGSGGTAGAGGSGESDIPRPDLTGKLDLPPETTMDSAGRRFARGMNRELAGDYGTIPRGRSGTPSKTGVGMLADKPLLVPGSQYGMPQEERGGSGTGSAKSPREQQRGRQSKQADDAPDAVADFANLNRALSRLPTIDRPIYVECRQDSLVVWETGRKLSINKLGLGGTVASLLEEVRRQQQSWETPGRISRLKPSLVFLVDPDACETFTSLWSRLIGSEIAIKSEIREKSASVFETTGHSE